MEQKLQNPVRLYNVAHPNPGAVIKDKDMIAFRVPQQGDHVVVDERVARRIIGTHMTPRRQPYFSLQAPAAKSNQAELDHRDSLIQLQAQKLAELEARLKELEKGEQEVIEDNVVDAGEYVEEEDVQVSPEPEQEPEVEVKRGKKK